MAGGAIGQAIDYSLNHWQALTLHLQDGAVPIDNNHLEQQIKPWKLGAKNWLFVGSELAGERALQPQRQIDWKSLLLWSLLVGGALLVAALGLSLLRQRPAPQD